MIVGCSHSFNVSDISCVSPLFFRSLDPCVVAVSRVLLKLIFVRNGSLGLSSNFIDVYSAINFLYTSPLP